MVMRRCRTLPALTALYCLSRADSLSLHGVIDRLRIHAFCRMKMRCGYYRGADDLLRFHAQMLYYYFHFLPSLFHRCLAGFALDTFKGHKLDSLHFMLPSGLHSRSSGFTAHFSSIFKMMDSPPPDITITLIFLHFISRYSCLAAVAWSASYQYVDEFQDFYATHTMPRW